MRLHLSKEERITEAKIETETFTCSDGKTIFVIKKKFIGSRSLKELLAKNILESENQRKKFNDKNNIVSLRNDVVEGGNNDQTT